jgi:hypothetical protein
MSNTRIHDEWGAFSAIPNEFIDASGDLSDQGRWLFVLLRRYTNGQTGKAFPSYKVIQDRTGWTPKTIAKAVRELEDAGWIEREKTYNGPTNYILKRNRHFPQGSAPLPVGKCSTSHREVGVLPTGKSNKTDINRLNKKTEVKSVVESSTALIAKPHTQQTEDAVSIALTYFPTMGIWQQELIANADINHLALWRQTMQIWSDHKWSKGNIHGMIDKYQRLETQNIRDKEYHNGQNQQHRPIRESHNERAARESLELIRQLRQEGSNDRPDPADSIFELPAAFRG